MGSPVSELDRGADEAQVEVTLTKPFRLGVHEVTQQQWKAIMGTEPWKDQEKVQQGDRVAATYVNWADANDFCSRLTERERTSGRRTEHEEYRLPTEAEWEFACRAGTQTTYSFGIDSTHLEEYAWGKGELYAREVGLKKPNPFGLYDVHGNVWEWCSDWYVETLPGGKNPTGPREGLGLVCRGAGWNDNAEFSRSGNRSQLVPSKSYSALGFRVVLTSHSP